MILVCWESLNMDIKVNDDPDSFSLRDACLSVRVRGAWCVEKL